MIEISPLAERARASGVPSACRHDLGNGAAADFEVDADGAVRMLSPGWLPVIEDGVITEFRPVPVDPFTAQDHDVIAIVEMLRKFTRNGAGLAEGAALTVAFLRDARNNPQEAT